MVKTNIIGVNKRPLKKGLSTGARTIFHGTKDVRSREKFVPINHHAKVAEVSKASLVLYSFVNETCR